MAKSKLKEELEEQDFSSFYRVDIYRLKDLYAMLDPKNPKDQEDIPFSGSDYFDVEKSYSIYMLDQKQVFERVKEAVEQDDSLYTMRVYQIPLNSWVLDDEYDGITVFNSKGEVVNSGREMFKAGEIVEFHDLKEDEVRLAVVYEPPKIEEVCELSEDSDDELYDQDQEDYKLITGEGVWNYVSASCVSRPSFPVADAFKEKLKCVYEKKIEDVKNRRFGFEDLLEFL